MGAVSKSDGQPLRNRLHLCTFVTESKKVKQSSCSVTENKYMIQEIHPANNIGSTLIRKTVLKRNRGYKAIGEDRRAENKPTDEKLSLAFPLKKGRSLKYSSASLEATLGFIFIEQTNEISYFWNKIILGTQK